MILFDLILCCHGCILAASFPCNCEQITMVNSGAIVIIGIQRYVFLGAFVLSRCYACSKLVDDWRAFIFSIFLSYSTSEWVFFFCYSGFVVGRYPLRVLSWDHWSGRLRSFHHQVMLAWPGDLMWHARLSFRWVDTCVGLWDCDNSRPLGEGMVLRIVLEIRKKLNRFEVHCSSIQLSVCRLFSHSLAHFNFGKWYLLGWMTAIQDRLCGIVISSHVVQVASFETRNYVCSTMLTLWSPYCDVLKMHTVYCFLSARIMICWNSTANSFEPKGKGQNGQISSMYPYSPCCSWKDFPVLRRAKQFGLCNGTAPIQKMGKAENEALWWTGLCPSQILRMLVQLTSIKTQLGRCWVSTVVLDQEHTGPWESHCWMDSFVTILYSADSVPARDLQGHFKHAPAI